MNNIIQGKDYAFTSMQNSTTKITCTCIVFGNRVHYAKHLCWRDS